MTTRREFLEIAGGSAAFALAGCTTGAAVKPRDGLLFGAVLHFGGNVWTDWVPGTRYLRSAEEERLEIAAGRLKPGKQMTRDYVVTDRIVWRSQLAFMREQGLNMVLIDVGEAYAYPSHPELWVNGSLGPDEMRKMLGEIRALGIEPIPKLNFSTCHDAWLREYHYMTSTEKYYQVVKDVIHDTCEVFDGPRYVHLGADEEFYGGLKKRALVVCRQGELWWKDLFRAVAEVERHNARAMVWSDRICNGKEEFLKQMPKSVLQLPWCYHADYSEKTTTWDPSFEKNLSDMSSQRNLAASIHILAEAGYDILPCTGNWKTDRSADAMLAYCRNRIDPARIKGFMTAAWKLSVPETDTKVRDAIRQLAEAKRKHWS